MNRTVNPDMIVLARESRGLTQSDLASMLGVTQAIISRYESKLRDVPPEQLAELSRVLDYPEEFFYQPDTIRAAGSSCLHHRKRQSMPIGDLKRIHAKINIVRIQMSRLMRGVAIERECDFPRMDVEDYADGPEEVARHVRKAWKLGTGPIRSMVGIIEDAGGVIFRCSFGTRKLDAISQWVPGLPPLFFVNDEAPTDRMRYSLAHELGHVVMHCVPTPNLEQEADRFAAELLMPAVDIRPHLRPLSVPKAAALKPHWKVSMAAIIKRAFDLKLIGESYYRKLFTQMSKLGYRKVEPAALPDEEPTMLRDIVQTYLRHHQYSIRELSAHVRLNEREFRKQYLPEQQVFRLVN